VVAKQTRLSVGVPRVRSPAKRPPRMHLPEESLMHLFSIAYDSLSDVIAESGGLENMSKEDRLQAIQIQALLSISQELSSFQDQEFSVRRD
jgi:hypothetical protein